MSEPFGLRPMFYVPAENVFLTRGIKTGYKGQLEGKVSLVTYFSESPAWELRRSELQQKFSVVTIATLNIDDLEDSVGVEIYKERAVAVFEEAFAAELTEFLFALNDENPTAFIAHPWDEELENVKPFAHWMTPDYVVLRVTMTHEAELREVESMLFEVASYLEFETDWKSQPTEFLIHISDAWQEFLAKNSN